VIKSVSKLRAGTLQLIQNHLLGDAW